MGNYVCQRQLKLEKLKRYDEKTVSIIPVVIWPAVLAVLDTCSLNEAFIRAVGG